MRCSRHIFRTKEQPSGRHPNSRIRRGIRAVTSVLESFSPFLCDSILRILSSPIGFREFSEDDYSNFIRTLSDELIKAGKRLVGSGNSEPPIPEILSRFVFSGKVSSGLR